MKVLVDENIPRSTVRALVALGHDVRDLRGTELEGLPDDGVWNLAQAEQRLLITTDRGFFRLGLPLHFGLLVVRLRQPKGIAIHDRILDALARFGAEQWPGMTVVMRDAAMSVWRPRDA